MLNQTKISLVIKGVSLSCAYTLAATRNEKQVSQMTIEISSDWFRDSPKAVKKPRLTGETRGLSLYLDSTHISVRRFEADMNVNFEDMRVWPWRWA